jgi:hypothetical protein
MRRLLFIVLLLLSPVLLFAQTVEHAVWGTFFNTTQINAKWGVQFDIQFRSANEYKYLRNMLIRPAIIYNLNRTNSIGLGYVLNDTYTHTSTPNTSENDIYEQFIHTQGIKAITITNRFRLEQRFIGKPAVADVFSQRFRYLLRAVIPLAKQKSAFKKGLYMAIQDEFFLNLQNKDQLNGSLFDQNRASANVGYRFSAKFDIEAGYANQVVKRTNNTLVNNIEQLSFYTRF